MRGETSKEKEAAPVMDGGVCVVVETRRRVETREKARPKCSVYRTGKNSIMDALMRVLKDIIIKFVFLVKYIFGHSYLKNVRF